MNNELLNQQFYRKWKSKQIRPMFKYVFNSVSKLKGIIVTDKLQFYILLQEVKVFQTQLYYDLYILYITMYYIYCIGFHQQCRRCGFDP